MVPVVTNLEDLPSRKNRKKTFREGPRVRSFPRGPSTNSHLTTQNETHTPGGKTEGHPIKPLQLPAKKIGASCYLGGSSL